MAIFKHKNISKVIILTSVLIILSNSLLISFFYVKNQMSEYDEKVNALTKQQIQKQKSMLKNDIANIIDTIDFWYQKNKNEKDLLKWLGAIKFDKEKSNYIFIYELHNINGGDKFAKLIINPNRPDIIGKFISDSYKDINGKEFRKEFLKGIRQDGEAFVEYSYKKTSTSENIKKISYFKYYKGLNWIVAKGVYDDDLQQQILLQKNELKRRVIKQINSNIIAFILISIIAVIVSLLIGKKIEGVLKQKNKEVEIKTQELENLNKNLEQRVGLEINKAKEKEQILVQKSKMIALGEMVSNIAHQWRQPISEISSIFMNLKMKYNLNLLTKEALDDKSKEIEGILEYMSQTIDDFRNFFKPNKQREDFNIDKSIKAVLNIIGTTLNTHNITVNQNIDKALIVNGYENEFEQVILNMISNAKDALVNRSIKEPVINIDAYSKNEKAIISIEDNGGGIDIDLKEKIFEPYFTTKDNTGTGIGLYMSKMIIETNMGGELNVENSQNGAKFTVKL